MRLFSRRSAKKNLQFYNLLMLRKPIYDVSLQCFILACFLIRRSRSEQDLVRDEDRVSELYTTVGPDGKTNLCTLIYGT